MDEITTEDIGKVIGIVLYIGNFRLPNKRMFWQNRTRVDVIAHSMPINRINKILSVLHFNQNNLIPKKDSPENNRCYKI